MKNKVCIVVPFRNREEHLKIFVPAMTEFLKKEGTEGSIFVVEQADDKPFNRAKLLNIGFHYVERNFPGEYSHYCFHDVDLVPEESDYTFCETPTHLSARAQQFGYKLPYNELFGGVTVFNRESFLKINGYSNEYWGWGGEDDDVYKRCKIMKIETRRKNGKYFSLPHERKIDRNLHQANVKRLASVSSIFNGKTFEEGLTTLDYTLKTVEENIGYVKIYVEL